MVEMSLGQILALILYLEIPKAEHRTFACKVGVLTHPRQPTAL